MLARGRPRLYAGVALAAMLACAAISGQERDGERRGAERAATVAADIKRYVTAPFVMKRRESDGARARWHMLPKADGLTVAYTVALRP